MKIAILSLDESLYSTRRLMEAGQQRGHTMRILHTLKCYMEISRQGPVIFYEGKKLPRFDAVIPRIGSSITTYGLMILRQFELLGTITANKVAGIALARDKWGSLQHMAHHQIPIPHSGLVRDFDYTEQMIAQLGGPPIILKLLEGSQGKGVMLLENLTTARGVTDTLRTLYQDFLLQEYIAESKGADIRCFIINGQPVAAMKRQAPAGEFRSNLHRGGKAVKIRLTPQEKTLSISAATTFGLDVAGIDLLRSARGPLVMEVNASPGLEGIEQCTGVDVAAKMIELLEMRR